MSLEIPDRDVSLSPPVFTGQLRDLAAVFTRQDHHDRRFLLGVVGEPGAGKSTVAGYLADTLGSQAAVVPFDGFHLANAILRGTDLRDRKGAIDTFDLAGYRLLIQRLRQADEPVVYAPSYVRDLEEPIAASIAIPRCTPIVITEGNYLLADHPDLQAVRSMLDEIWYIEADADTRKHQLIQRHIRFGKTPAAATAWAAGPDETNARVIRATRDRADLVIRIQELLSPPRA